MKAFENKDQGHWEKGQLAKHLPASVLFTSFTNGGRAGGPEGRERVGVIIKAGERLDFVSIKSRKKRTLHLSQCLMGPHLPLELYELAMFYWSERAGSFPFPCLLFSPSPPVSPPSSNLPCHLSFPPLYLHILFTIHCHSRLSLAGASKLPAGVRQPHRRVHRLRGAQTGADQENCAHPSQARGGAPSRQEDQAAAESFGGGLPRGKTATQCHLCTSSVL